MAEPAQPLRRSPLGRTVVLTVLGALAALAGGGCVAVAVEQHRAASTPVVVARAVLAGSGPTTDRADEVAGRAMARLPAGGWALVGLPSAHAPRDFGPGRIRTIQGDRGRRVDVVLTGTAPVPGNTVDSDSWLRTAPLPGFVRLASTDRWVAVRLAPTSWWEERTGVLGLAALASSFLIGCVLLGRRPSRRPDRIGRSCDHRSGTEQIEELNRQRHILVSHLARLAPQLPKTLGRQTVLALEQAGYSPVVPDREPFDASRHRAIGTDRTTDPELADRVSRTLRPGYAAGPEVIVEPLVSVYRVDQPGQAGPEPSA